ncbi:MAG: tRNA uridine-5-carboxymethylaminomethyl(34) synthesis GTPase MnmE [Alphaproteobacteria bacterium]|nr:tRNA uridine-5-carboxymethylaminomethyl(34) synthesis GTPase MnmE [Alphaproteobacteria bacterium]
MNNDTIFALSSAHGKSGVAVIRISGQNLIDLAKQIIFSPSGGVRHSRRGVEPRHAYFTNLKDDNGDLIDQCIAIYFNAPYSFTGEDIIEIHSHGSPAVINKIFEFLRNHGCRIANRGEFSRRAFYNNKMDLTDVDGLIALLDAQTDKQRQSALRSLTGHDSIIYNNWRESMIEISAYSAAILDYADDELPKNIDKKILNKTKKLLEEIKSSLSQSRASRAIQNGFNIVLVGKTNVGKSSIFNKLVGSNRAIVSSIAGTTRDVVSQQIDIDGYLVNLSDTAGIRQSRNKIEKIGIERTHNEIENADLILYVYNEMPQELKTDGITIINKSDLLKSKTSKRVIYTSVKNNTGFDKLLKTIKEKMHELMGNGESKLAINERTYELLNESVSELQSALDKYDGNYDIFAEHVRRAGDAIGKILGVITTNEIADMTFQRLCLGK